MNKGNAASQPALLLVFFPVNILRSRPHGLWFGKAGPFSLFCLFSGVAGSEISSM